MQLFEDSLKELKNMKARKVNKINLLIDCSLNALTCYDCRICTNDMENMHDSFFM